MTLANTQGDGNKIQDNLSIVENLDKTNKISCYRGKISIFTQEKVDADKQDW